jgi:RPA family protein
MYLWWRRSVARRAEDRNGEWGERKANVSHVEPEKLLINVWLVKTNHETVSTLKTIKKQLEKQRKNRLYSLLFASDLQSRKS